MRRSTLFAFGLIGLAALTGGCRFLRIDSQTIELLKLPAQPPPSRNQSVDVDVQCPSATEIFVAVIPWSVRVRPGFGVQWNMLGNATQLDINPKVRARWPFAGTPPHRTTNPNQSANSGNSRANAPLTSYSYTATVTCRVPNTTTDVVVTIDPDIILTF